MAKVVLGVPMAMSQVTARSQAPPHTLPSIMAMTGTGTVLHRPQGHGQVVVVAQGIDAGIGQLVDVEPGAPDLAALGARRMMARAWSSTMVRMDCSMPLSMASERQFLCATLFRVMMPIPSFSSVSTWPIQPPETSK